MLPSTELPTRARRAARGIGAGTIAVLVALAGHAVGGGQVPPAMLLATTVVLSWLPGIALAGRRSSLWRQVVLVALTQGALHVLFTIEALPVSGSVSSTMPGMAMPGMMMPGLTMPGVSPALQAGTSVIGMPDALMWSGHGLAAVVTVIAWRRVEAAVQRVRRAALQLVIAAFVIVLATPQRSRDADTPFSPSPRREGRDATTSISRRGPPVPAFSTVSRAVRTPSGLSPDVGFSRPSRHRARFVPFHGRSGVSRSCTSTLSGEGAQSSR